MKYVMNMTDQIEDIRKLEEEFGFDSIEMFIQNLYDELSLVDDMKRIKPWIEDTTPNYSRTPYDHLRRDELKHMLNEKREREKIKFLAQ